MSKTLAELKPTDRVIIEFGPKQQQDADSGEFVTIEKAKTQEVPFAYFQQITEKEEYNEKTGFYKLIGRTVKLKGLAEFETVESENGGPVEIAKAVPLAKKGSKTEPTT